MTNPYRRGAPSPKAIRTAYALTPSTSSDTAHALQVLHGLSVRRIAMACQISAETLSARLNERVNFIRKANHA